MATTLRDIVEAASQTFPDHFLQKHLEKRLPTYVEDLKITETLAAYLVKEFSELYDADSSNRANVERITTSLERSVHLLEKVTQQLKELGLD